MDAAGRLAPIAALVDAARNGAADLAARVDEWFGDEMPIPPGIKKGRAAVWRDTGVFAIAWEQQPALSIDGGDALPMTAVPGTPYWFRLETLEQGRLHSFRYFLDGEWSDAHDVAGYNPSSYELPDVSTGHGLGETVRLEPDLPGSDDRVLAVRESRHRRDAGRAGDGLARRSAPSGAVRPAQPPDADRHRQPRAPGADPADGARARVTEHG